MSSTLDWGYFSNLWLSLKQGVMFAILAGMALVGPRMIRLKRAFLELSPHEPVPVAIREVFFGTEPWFLAMRVGGLASVLLAVWRPSM